MRKVKFKHKICQLATLQLLAAHHTTTTTTTTTILPPPILLPSPPTSLHPNLGPLDSSIFLPQIFRSNSNPFHPPISTTFLACLVTVYIHSFFGFPPGRVPHIYPWFSGCIHPQQLPYGRRVWKLAQHWTAPDSLCKVGEKCKLVKSHLLLCVLCKGPSKSNLILVGRPVRRSTRQVGWKVQGNSLKPVLCGKVACTYCWAKSRCLASLRKSNCRVHSAVRALSVTTNNGRPKHVSYPAAVIRHCPNKQTRFISCSSNPSLP